MCALIRVHFYILNHIRTHMNECIWTNNWIWIKSKNLIKIFNSFMNKHWWHIYNNKQLLCINNFQKPKYFEFAHDRKLHTYIFAIILETTRPVDGFGRLSYPQRAVQRILWHVSNVFFLKVLQFILLWCNIATWT